MQRSKSFPEYRAICLQAQSFSVSFKKMPKRKIARSLEPSKRKNVAIPKAVKNEIREMIKKGLKKSEVEARLQKEKKIEGGINIYQWNRLSASRNQPQEIIETQPFRTKKNLSTEEFKDECLKIFRGKSQKSALGVDGLMLVRQALSASK